jgi:cyclopropane fatty-acyl-phospholipid synthase-like methyltransferase
MSDQNKNIVYYNTNAPAVFNRYQSTDMGAIQEALFAWLKDCNKVLELGSGAGREAMYLLEKGVDYYGIDGSAALCSMVLEQHPELEGRIRVHDMTEGLPDLPHRFDAVFSIATLMHFAPTQLNNLLTSLSACLHPNAKAFFSVSGPSIIRQKDPRYFNDLNRTDYENLFTDHGWEIREMSEWADVLDRPLQWFNFYLERI